MNDIREIKLIHLDQQPVFIAEKGSIAISRHTYLINKSKTIAYQGFNNITLYTSTLLQCIVNTLSVVFTIYLSYTAIVIRVFFYG